jgi:hypothetical protein
MTRLHESHPTGLHVLLPDNPYERRLRPPARVCRTSEMSTWIGRYQAGEHALVWAELEALGSDIVAPPYQEAAREVVLETIGRARRNVLQLFESLTQLGYRFHGARDPSPPDYPLELRIHGALEHVRAVGGKRYAADPFAHPAFAFLEEEELELPAHYRHARPGRASYRPPSFKTAEMLEQVELRLGGPLPLAARCWFETIGWVDLAGTHPALNQDGAIATLRVAPEPGDPAAWAGCAGAEFVALIRHAFEWAGFPGWSGMANAPERELAWLRSKLLPL